MYIEAVTSYVYAIYDIQLPVWLLLPSRCFLLILPVGQPEMDV